MGWMKRGYEGRGGGRRGRSQGAGISVRWFFDRPEVLRQIKKGERTYLSKGGALLRREARASIKRKGHARKAPPKLTPKGRRSKAYQRWRQEVMNQPASPPGSPPFTHTGFLKEDILYAYDRGSNSAVIGPWRCPWLNKLHEFGGTVARDKVTWGKATWMVRPGTRIPKGARRKGRVMAKYPARPFMSSTLKRMKPRLRKLWAECVREKLD